MGTIAVRLFLLLMHSILPEQQQFPAGLKSFKITTYQSVYPHDLQGPVRFIETGPLEFQGYTSAKEKNTNL